MAIKPQNAATPLLLAQGLQSGSGLNASTVQKKLDESCQSLFSSAHSFFTCYGDWMRNQGRPSPGKINAKQKIETFMKGLCLTEGERVLNLSQFLKTDVPPFVFGKEFQDKLKQHFMGVIYPYDAIKLASSECEFDLSKEGVEKAFLEHRTLDHVKEKIRLFLEDTSMTVLDLRAEDPKRIPNFLQSNKFVECFSRYRPAMSLNFAYDRKFIFNYETRVNNPSSTTIPESADALRVRAPSNCLTACFQSCFGLKTS